ncbi:hypothetical protein VTL71DRAFT_10362 [Oculimacula yallundae]|uniref:2EXR domain-containing protein n=1 Tax=Oculimacula yallundae TaxID=86028 RepID=A0ABR4CSS0_9HELO
MSEQTSAEQPSKGTSPTLDVGCQFHLFPNLPLELQREIWEHAAAAPRLFDFKFAGVDENYNSFIDGTFSTLQNYEKGNFESLSLDLACWESHRAMQLIRGNGYVVGPPIKPHHNDISSSFWFRYNPVFDTLYFPGCQELSKFAYSRNVSAGKVAVPGSGLGAIRSVALSGFLENSVRDMREGQDNPSYRIPMICFSMTQWLWGVLYPLSMLGKFSGLQELILLHPGMAQMSADRRLRDDRSGQQRHKEMVTINTEETEKNIQTWKSGLEIDIKDFPFAVWGLEEERRLERASIKFSAWWSDPKVTIMTEEEFMARN